VDLEARHEAAGARVVARRLLLRQGNDFGDLGLAQAVDKLQFTYGLAEDALDREDARLERERSQRVALVKIKRSISAGSRVEKRTSRSFFIS
jgi:hypothetical protein